MLRFALRACIVLFAVLGIEVAAADNARAPKPPVADVKPKIFEEHGRQRGDNYYWLKERENRDVLAYLRAENAYANARLRPLKPAIAKIHSQMRSHLGDSILGAPFVENGYLYWGGFEKGAEYRVIRRRKNHPQAAAEVVLDVPKIARGHRQFILANWVVSPDGKSVAYAVDFSGGNAHRVYVRSIASGKIIDQSIDGVAEDLVFSADGKFLFYHGAEEGRDGRSRVWRHAIGADPANDKMMYEETDDTFGLKLRLSKSRRFVLLEADHQQTTEVRFLRTNDPAGEFKLIEPRQVGVRYYVDHVGDRFYILTNLGAADFRVVAAPDSAPEAAGWTTLIAETRGRYIESFLAFDTFIAIEENHDAVRSVRVLRLADRKMIPVPRSMEIGVASLSRPPNRDPTASKLRFVFESPLQPRTVYEFDVETGALARLLQQAPGERFLPNQYAVERVDATAPDGERIPVTIVYRKDMRKPGGNPTLVYGYGAYGSSVDPDFLVSWYALINSGFVFAIAHVRGGRELGQRWYDGGRLLAKKNTFTDFIAATEALIALGYADRKNVFARGASAGGLLMGAIANLRPDLYAGIVAEVPFVDAITSMSDPAVPLTTFEYKEWGNPTIKEEYDYMLAYSPYDNVSAQDYPAMLVTAGIHDRQVDYSEAAKWVARLRATKTDRNELLFLTDMESGHSGLSGRLRWLEQRAMVIAWLIGHVR